MPSIAKRFCPNDDRPGSDPLRVAAKQDLNAAALIRQEKGPGRITAASEAFLWGKGTPWRRRDAARCEGTGNGGRPARDGGSSGLRNAAGGSERFGGGVADGR